MQMREVDVFTLLGEALKRCLTDEGSGYLEKIVQSTAEFFMVKNLALPMVIFPEPTIMHRSSYLFIDWKD